MPELDPLTGKDPSTLTLAQLTERLAMERALREQEFVALRELLGAVKDAIVAQAVNDRRALELQAAVYEQRLEVLNHAHAAAVEAQAMTVPREMFDQYVKETSSREDALVDTWSERVTSTTASMNDRLNVTNKRIDELQNWRSGLEGRLIGVSAVIGVVVIVINIAIRVI